MSYSFSEIFDKVSPEDYYSKIFGVLPKAKANGEIMVKCPFHDDTEGSLSINVVSRGGVFHCHGCGKSGNYFEFHKTYKGIVDLEASITDFIEFLEIDVRTYKSDFCDDGNLPRFHDDLLQDKKLLHYLANERGITKVTVEAFNLGLEIRHINNKYEPRITIPIRDAKNKLVNIRRWLPTIYRTSERHEKMKTIGMEGFNSNVIFPIEALSEKEIVICEGEMDVMVLRSHGFNALSSTAGVNSFKKRWFKLLADKDVIIAFDNDEEGQKAAHDLLTGLYDFVRSVKIVAFNTVLDNKDITDLWKEHKTDFKEYFRTLIDTTPHFNKVSDIEQDAIEVNLYQAARFDLIGRKIKVRALIAGKEDRPFAVPKRIRLTCNAKKKSCPNCPGIISDGTLEKVVKKNSPYLLDLLLTTRYNHSVIYRKIFDVHCKVSNAFEIIEEQNVEEIRLIPDLDMSSSTVTYTIRQAYYVGFGLDYNEVYDFTGMTTIDPRNNAVTHVFWKAERVNKAKDSIEMSDKIECDGESKSVIEHLKVFRPTPNQTPMNKLREIYTDFEYNVTGIIKRQDIIQAIDLTYCSCMAFTLGNEFEKKGWLDTLILGDTACGKTRTMKAMIEHYRAGQIYDGTHISTVGIIGGYISISGSNKTRYVLGVWPLNDGKLVCLDELSGMSSYQVGQLTSVRSEGIAESTKQGQRNRYPARVRFICLSNPRNNKSIQDYAFGVKAVQDLIGEDADISRYDVAMIAAGNEVSHQEINNQHKIYVEHKYTSDLCRLHIDWAWSRTPSQIQFTPTALSLIMEESDKLGRTYDSSIPIVLGQSQRKKLARLSIAVAIRLFSSPDGKNVLVERDHVEAAVKFLTDCFNKPSMGYHTYSAIQRKDSTLPNVEGVKELLDKTYYMMVEYLISSRTGNISFKDIVEYSGEHEVKSKQFFRELIRFRCIVKKGRFYNCTPAFLAFLQSYEHPEKDTYYLTETLNTEIDVD